MFQSQTGPRGLAACGIPGLISRANDSFNPRREPGALQPRCVCLVVCTQGRVSIPDENQGPWSHGALIPCKRTIWKFQSRTGAWGLGAYYTVCGGGTFCEFQSQTGAWGLGAGIIVVATFNSFPFQSQTGPMGLGALTTITISTPVSISFNPGREPAALEPSMPRRGIKTKRCFNPGQDPGALEPHDVLSVDFSGFEFQSLMGRRSPVD